MMKNSCRKTNQATHDHYPIIFVFHTLFSKDPIGFYKYQYINYENLTLKYTKQTIFLKKKLFHKQFFAFNFQTKFSTLKPFQKNIFGHKWMNID